MNGARVGDLFMSLIHTCELNQVNPFDYLTELLRHPAEVTVHPAEWMPWNYMARRNRGGRVISWFGRMAESISLKPCASDTLEMAVKQASKTAKSQRVFGQRQEPAKMFRVGLYARVSTHDQQTLPLQMRAMREYAARRGWTIAMQIREVGSGAVQRQAREQPLKAARRRDPIRAAHQASEVKPGSKLRWQDRTSEIRPSEYSPTVGDDAISSIANRPRDYCEPGGGKLPGTVEPLENVDPRGRSHQQGAILGFDDHRIGQTSR